MSGGCWRSSWPPVSSRSCWSSSTAEPRSTSGLALVGSARLPCAPTRPSKEAPRRPRGCRGAFVASRSLVFERGFAAVCDDLAAAGRAGAAEPGGSNRSIRTSDAPPAPPLSWRQRRCARPPGRVSD
jgi:hypothetical protein